MIEKRDEVLGSYTDEHLLEWRERGDGQRVYANLMLQAPPEYRWGVANRASELMNRAEHRNGLYVYASTGVGYDDAHKQALDELKAQGVALLPVPA